MAGDFLGLIGPNGGGKSTLLKVMLGLIKPDRGSIALFGLPPAAARSRVGYMPQKTVFDQSFPVNVLDVVLMGRYSRTGLLHRYGSQDRQAALRLSRPWEWKIELCARSVLSREESSRGSL